MSFKADIGEVVDVLVVGGGANGCGIARDATGRGLSALLEEMDDLASGIFGGSTKLCHGGLRYLEYFEVGLIREAFMEPEVLLRAMPHISWPMRFDFPYHKDMRFESETPFSRLLGALMAWMRRRGSAWMIRCPDMQGAWTATATLPGGDFAVGDVQALIDQLRHHHPLLSQTRARRLVRFYGMDAARMLNGAQRADQLGRHLGHTLHEAEVR